MGIRECRCEVHMRVEMFNMGVGRYSMGVEMFNMGVG